MNNALNKFILKQRLISAYKNFGMFVIAVIALLAFAYEANNARVAYVGHAAALDNITLQKSNVQSLNARLTLTRREFDLVYENSKVFLPGSDNVFSIVKTLDQLSAISGCTLESYTVGSSGGQAKSADNFTSIAATYDCASASLPLLFDRYQSSTGRLMALTGTTIEITQSGAHKARLDLRLYRARAVGESAKFVPLNGQDVQYLRDRAPQFFTTTPPSTPIDPSLDDEYEIQSIL